jgi:subtilisin family serine protease
MRFFPFLLPLVQAKNWIVCIDHTKVNCRETINEINSLFIGVTNTPLISQNDCYLVVNDEDIDMDTIVNIDGVAFIEEDTEVSVEDLSWGLDRIDQRTLPLNNRFIWGFGGAGQVVYILDTGIYTGHTEFKKDRARFGTKTTNWWSNEDRHGHGTHCAGIAIGERYGVAKKATAISVKVLGDNGNGPVSGVIKGLQWVQKNAKQPSVISMSLGGPRSKALDAAVRSAAGSGHIVVVAAGNGNTNACFFSPARVGGKAGKNGVLTAASSTSKDFRSYFSNHGTCTDLFAPGSGIESAGIRSSTQIVVKSGTSMSAPFISGVLLTLLEKNQGHKQKSITELIDMSTKGAIKGIEGKNTPNRLLYSGNKTKRPTPAPTEQRCDELQRRRCKRRRDCAWKKNPAGRKRECVEVGTTPFPTPSPTKPVCPRICDECE